ncbi:hypothetical protein [Komagataeibacter sp. FNDCF1]|uniref:hypothetical protein n=1 Tax=Komagataeibacter sp. FNDCF1 TaxID=2878681 RepID=UPI001E6092ED|nr:hypothetical protein [Komagataeibacter sp. FNDCF1]MCE2565732.1 hypothetical protein [Komagataeibacter sp. FNDCF1]
MTSRIKILYAQSLDNTSPNPMTLNGNFLAAENQEERQEAASILSLISKNSTKTTVHNGTKLIESKGNGFIFELPCAEKDILSRDTFIVFCEKSDFNASAEKLNSIKYEVTKFAKYIKRNVDAESVMLFSKRSSYATIFIAGIFCFSFISFFSYYFMVK